MTKAKRKTTNGANHICQSVWLLFAGIAISKKNGAFCGNRTHDLLLRREPLYPTELRKRPDSPKNLPAAAGEPPRRSGSALGGKVDFPETSPPSFRRLTPYS